MRSNTIANMTGFTGEIEQVDHRPDGLWAFSETIEVRHYKAVVQRTTSGKPRTMTIYYSAGGLAHHGRCPELGDVLRAVVGDADAGNYDLDEFRSEFGYDDGDDSARKIWRACKKARTDLRRLLDGDESNLNRLIEMFGNASDR